VGNVVPFDMAKKRFARRLDVLNSDIISVCVFLTILFLQMLQ
jgi:hypothetical protein